MPTGTVKWFNNAKGYGFILPDQGGEDLFVHYTSIVMEGYKTLKAGQMVAFDIVKGGKGLHATNIKAPDIKAPDSAPEEDKPSSPSATTTSADGDAESATKNPEVEAVS